MKHSVVWFVFLTAVVLTLGLKAFGEGWFVVREPLLPGGQPALVFFTLSDGCECQMTVVRAAEAQLANWISPLALQRVDFNNRRGLAKQFGVTSAPALVLLDAEGQVVWKHDVGMDNEAPLDLNQAERQIEAHVGQKLP